MTTATEKCPITPLIVPDLIGIAICLLGIVLVGRMFHDYTEGGQLERLYFTGIYGGLGLAHVLMSVGVVLGSRHRCRPVLRVLLRTLAAIFLTLSGGTFLVMFFLG